MKTDPAMTKRWSEKRPVGSLDKKSPAHETAESYPPITPEKLIGAQSAHNQINYQSTGQS